MKCCNSEEVCAVNSCIVIVPHTPLTHTHTDQARSLIRLWYHAIYHTNTHMEGDTVWSTLPPLHALPQKIEIHRFNWFLLLDASWRVGVSRGYWEVSVKRTLLFWSVDPELWSQGETSALTLPLLCECKLTFAINQCIISVIVVYMLNYCNWVALFRWLNIWVESKTPWWIWHIKEHMKLI